MENDELLRSDPAGIPGGDVPWVTERETRINPDGSQSVIERTYAKEAFLLKMVNDSEMEAAKHADEDRRLQQLTDIIDKDNASQLAIEQTKLMQQQQQAQFAAQQQMMMQQMYLMTCQQNAMLMRQAQAAFAPMMLPPQSVEVTADQLLLGEPNKNNQPKISHGIAEDVEYVVCDENTFPPSFGHASFQPQQPPVQNNGANPYNGINFSDVESGL